MAEFSAILHFFSRLVVVEKKRKKDFVQPDNFFNKITNL